MLKLLKCYSVPFCLAYTLLGDITVWKLFRLNTKKNSIFAFFILFFNFFAACLEGVSFGFLLLGIAALTNESIALPPVFSFLEGKVNNSLVLSLGGAMFFQMLRSLSTYLGHYFTILLTVNIQTEAQKQTFERILHMPWVQVAEMKKGDLMHQVTAPPSFIPMLYDEYNRFFVSALMIFTYLIIMFRISWQLTCIILGCFVAAALIQKVLLRNISNASRIHNDHITDLSKETAQNLDSLKLIHILQRQPLILRKMESILQLIAGATTRLKRLNTFIPTINESLGVLLVGISLLAGVFFLKKDGKTFAAFLFTYLTLTYRLGTRIQFAMLAKGIISYYSGPLKKLEEMLARDVYINQKINEPEVLFKQAIAFKNVSFSYSHKDSPALKNISLTIPHKSVVAVVGTSGAGKSTLIDLLMRLYEPQEGKIMLDDTDAEHFSLNQWRSLFGIVPQDSFLFHDTIEENIRFGRLSATEDEVVQAAKLAGAHSFIEALPQKYKTIVGEKGYRLSGGEKQRISMAQALVRHSQILVLDEATSHLDSHSEQVIQNSLEELRSEKTIIIVAHRLSTLQLADHIIVMDKGSIVETGTHHDLVALGGRYYTFWNLQSGSLNENAPLLSTSK